MPFVEPGAQVILENLTEEKLFAHTELSFISESEVCILIIGTPVLDDGNPSISPLLALVNEMIPFLLKVKILILRSTVYPGVTKKIKEFLLTKGLVIEVAFCPERLIEGNAIYELKNLPQVIGADTEESYNLAFKIFNEISPEILRTQIEEAELVKLFANAFRYFQFGLANEFFKICVDKGINWETVWKALKYRYPRTESLPTPGFAAGPCLVKDTQQLSYYYGQNFRLGREILEINESLPDFLVNKLIKKYEISNMTIGILGMTFKGEIDDFRQSLSFRLKRILETKAKRVLCSDTKIQKAYFVDTNTLVQESDIIIVAAAHHEYKNLNFSKPVIDIWRITNTKSLI
jgi:UDP-N-acetyl-D-mannosaminuronic acid dehydrogenase